VVRECSSGLLIELRKRKTTADAAAPRPGHYDDEEEVGRLVCYPYPKVYEIGHANAEQIDWVESIGEGAKSFKVFRLEITDNARVVSLYHHADEWRICSSESTDCSDRICRVRVKQQADATSHQLETGSEQAGGGGGEDRHYLNFPSTTHYNPWNFFEEKLAKPRQSFAAFTTASDSASRPAGACSQHLATQLLLAC
jgi:hypothetical protein